MNCLLLPVDLLAAARTFFEDCGTRGHEGTAMVKNGPRGPALVVPDQRPWRGPTGAVSVEVTRRGQMQLALALSPDDLYIARIHSHPAEAFHSPADDANPVLTHEGALSIVVPSSVSGCALAWTRAPCCAVRRVAGGRYQQARSAIGGSGPARRKTDEH